VIKRGWDWLGVTPSAPGRTSGLIEAPDLAACLTLSKSDFIRTGTRGAAYLAYRKAIQEVVSRQLAAWGDAPDADARPRTQRLERDLARVLEDMADDFPLLRSLVDHRPGGQKRLPMPGRGGDRVPGSLFANGAEARAPGREPSAVDPPAPSDPPEAPRPETERPPAEDTVERDAGAAMLDVPSGTLSAAPGRRRPAHYGLMVQFESRPDDPELGRLVDSTIWINDAHPAYARAAASRSAGYHAALSVALALAPLAVETTGEHAFITRFLAHWGGAPARGAATRGRRRRLA
jgi:hypothetical protein